MTRGTSRSTRWLSKWVRSSGCTQTADSVFQDLFSDHGFRGIYYSVHHFVRRSMLPVRRTECTRGEEVRVDFGNDAFMHFGGVAERILLDNQRSQCGSSNH